MELKEYVESEIKPVINNIFTEDKCTKCGSTGNLSLQHSLRTFNLLDRAIFELGYTGKAGKDDYNKAELSTLVSCVLGLYVYNRRYLLCESCRVE